MNLLANVFDKTRGIRGVSRFPVLALLLLIAAGPGFGLQRWARTYGGIRDDDAFSVEQTSDGGYVMAGLTQSFAPWPSYVYLVKTDSNGDTLWTRTWGGTADDMAYSVQPTLDGGYILAGYTASRGAGGNDVWLIKTDASGDTLWTRTYGGSGDDQGWSVQQTLDSGYIVGGLTASFGAGEYGFYLIKTDASGDTQWTRTYGGSGEEAYSVQQTRDSGYIMTGVSGNMDVWLVKTNASGDTQWTRSYGGTYLDQGLAVRQTLDSGYIVTGLTRSFGHADYSVYLIKTDAAGDTQWTRVYGPSRINEGYSVRQTSDGGYIVAGSTNGIGAGNDDVWLLKTDASGDTEWTRTFGGTNGDDAYSVQQPRDGGYIVAGGTASFGAGMDDVWLIKTDANGSAGVEEPTAPRLKNSGTALRVQPNPFSSFAVVPGHEAESFILSDISGRRVAVSRGDRIGEGLPPGVYFLSPVARQDIPCARPVRIVKAQ